MAKRFTDTNKYKKPFIRGLQGAYKLLWDYLYHDCDHAGIWIVDFDIAQIYIGNDMQVNKSDALKYFNTTEIKIVEIDNSTKWFIPSFIEFQYGTLNEQNRAHNSVIKILSKYKLYEKNKGLITPLKGRKEEDMDMDKEKDKVKEKGFEIYKKFAHLKMLINEFDKLEKFYTKNEIDNILIKIENYKKNTNYKSLYLTSLVWLKKEYGERNYQNNNHDPNLLK